MLFPLFNKAISALLLKLTLKKTPRIKQVLMLMDVKEELLVKSLRELLTIIVYLSQNKKKHKLYISKKNRQVCFMWMVRKRKYTHNSQEKIHFLFLKLLCKPRDQMTTEDKSKIVFKVDFSSCKLVCEILVNLASLCNRDQMNRKDPLKTAIR